MVSSNCTGRIGLWTKRSNGGRQRLHGFPTRAGQGERDEGDVAPGRLLANLFGERQPALVRQLPIEDHGVEEIALGQPCQRVVAVRGRFHGQAPLLAATRDDAAIGRIVFDDQEALACELRLGRLPGGRHGGGRQPGPKS